MYEICPLELSRRADPGAIAGYVLRRRAGTARDAEEIERVLFCEGLEVESLAPVATLESPLLARKCFRWLCDGMIEVIDVDIDEICHAIATGRGLADLATSPSYTVRRDPENSR